MGQREQEQDRTDRHDQPLGDAVEHVRQHLFSLGEHAESMIGVGNRRDHRQQAERGHQPRLLGAIPAERARHRIGPDRQMMADPARGGFQRVAAIEPARQGVEAEVGGERGTQRQQQPERLQCANRKGEAGDQQRKDVIGNADQQKESQRRVARPQRQPSDDIAERDIARHRHRPPGRRAGQHRGGDKVRETRVKQRRHRRRDKGRDQRGHRPGAAQRAVTQRQRLPQLLADVEKEECHQRIARQVAQRQRAPEGHQAVGIRVADQRIVGQPKLDKVLIAARREIRPGQRDGGPGQQAERELRDEMRDAIHRRASNGDPGRRGPGRRGSG